MKSNLKRIISIVLTAILIVGTVAIVPQAGVSAAETSENYVELLPRGEGGTIITGDISRDSSYGTVTYSYNLTTKELIISGDGEMMSLQPALSSGSGLVWADVKTVVVEEGVKSIGDRCFYNCQNLVDVSLPNSLRTIESLAFWGCTSLESIYIPKNVKRILATAFYQCTKLTKVEFAPEIMVKDNIVSGGTNKGSAHAMLNGCTSLQEVRIPSGFSSIGVDFAKNCSNLEYVEIEDGPTQILANAFSQTKLNHIVIPESVTYIDETALPQGQMVYIYGYIGTAAETFAYSHSNCRFVNLKFNGLPTNRKIKVTYCYGGPQGPRSDMVFDPTNMDGYKFIDEKEIGFGEYAENIVPTVPSGKVFCGWYTKDELDPAVFCDGQPFNVAKTKLYNNIELYAKIEDVKPNYVNYNEDIFSFDNPSHVNGNTLNSLYYIHLREQATFIQRLGGLFNIGKLKGRLRSLDESPKGGICFGMSSLLILSKLDKLDLSYFNVDSVSEIANPMKVDRKRTKSNYIDWNTTQLLLYLYNEQNCGYTRKVLTKRFLGTNKSHIKALVNKAVGCVKPFLLTLGTEGRFKGGHAVVVYGGTKNSDGSYTINYWDPNEGWRASVIEINSSCTEALFKYYDPNSGQTYFDRYTDDAYIRGYLNASELDTYDIVGYLKDSNYHLKPRGEAPEFDEDEASTDIEITLTVNYSNFTITSSNGKSATIKDHEFSSGDADLIEPLGMAGVSGDEGYLYMIYPQGDDVTYTVLPEAESGLEEYDTAFIRDEYEEIGGGATTMSSTPISSTFSMDGTVETTSSSAVEQMVFTIRNDVTTPWYTTAFKGSTTGIKVVPTTTTTTAYTKSDCTLQMETGDDYTTVSDENVAVGANQPIVISCVNDRDVNVSVNGTTVSTQPLPYIAQFITGTSSVCEDQIGLHTGDKLTEPFAINPGYKATWYTNPEFTGTPWNFNTDTVGTSDIMLYAKWTYDSKQWINVKYYSDGELHKDDKVVIDAPQLTKLAAAPEKDGYMFTGWYLDEKCTKVVPKDYIFDEETKLYAGWKEISTVDIESADTSAVFGNNGKYSSFGLAGIQIKILESDTDAYGNGLRFCLTLGKDLYDELVYLYGDSNIKFGNVVALKDRVQNVNSLKLETTGALDSPSNNIFYDGSKYQVATTLIHHIPKENYATDIVARSYIKYVDRNGNDQIYYFTENESAHVCARGYYTSLYTAADFIYTNDPSRYSQSAIEYLKSIINS
ncbi:MAG: leucine-rich repeat protein [Clostridia bacterium]|nr:leucine-rich repeat protein [Clostridia bacterium]